MPASDTQDPGWIINSRLGSKGRFANQIFQYMFLSCHARTHGLRFANLPWLGDHVFSIQKGVEPLPAVSRTLFEVGSYRPACPISTATGPLADTDIAGYFQFHMSYFAPFRDHILKEFAFRGAYADYAGAVADWFNAQPRPVAAVHIRRGDYGYRYFFRAPVDWYLDWLDAVQDQNGPISVYVATDEPETVLPQFKGFHVLTPRAGPSAKGIPPHIVDFIALTQARKVAISNSSFSFAATLFNRNADAFMRPTLTDMGLIPYEPWDADVLRKEHHAEEFGGHFVVPPKPTGLRKIVRSINRLKYRFVR